MSGALVLDERKSEPSVEFMAGLRAAQAAGRSLGAVLLEVLRTARGPGRLTPHEYFYYRLYEDAISRDEKLRFLGKRAQDRILLRCTDRDWWLTVHDKLLFEALMRGSDVPVPATIAVYDPVREAGDGRVLRGAEELVAFLRDPGGCPFFSKPVRGMFSVGSAAVERRDPETDELVSTTGDRCTVEDFARQVQGVAEFGYLFQERLRPHPALEELCGDRLGTIRVVIMMAEEGPEIIHTLWKVPAGGNASDNFWREGNMIGAVDRDSGEVRRVVSGVGPAQVEHETHPDTGRRLVGFRLPGWDEALDLACRGARVLAGLSLQGWDVALTPDGPVVVEANVGGDVNLPQLAEARGMLDERLGRFLAERRYR